MDRELKAERYTEEARTLFARAQARADGAGHAELSPLHLFAELVAAHPAVFRATSVDPVALLERVETQLSQSASGHPPARFDGSTQELILRVERIARAPERQVTVEHVAQALFEKRAVQSLPGAVIAPNGFRVAGTPGAPAEIAAEPPLPSRPPAARAPLPAPPRADGTTSNLFQRVAVELRTPTVRSSWVTLVVLLASLALFVLSLGESSGLAVAMIVGVLLFHEAGHWVGMRVFGYRDVRMFFIPFFGAAVSGDPDGVASWKRGVVLLLGPIPGIILACAVGLVFRGTHLPWLKTLALTLASVNALNLLPFEPLDGGRIVHLVLASRARFLDVISLVAAAAGLAWLGFKLDTTMFYVLAGLTLLGVGRRISILRAAKSVRTKHPDLPVQLRQATDAQLADILDQVLTFTPHPEPVSDARVRTLAASCRQVYSRATSTAPRWSLSAALGAAQLVGFAFGLLALVLAVEPARAGGPLQQLTQTKSLADGSITVHYPASFTAKITGSDNTTLVVSRSVGGHLEAVSATIWPQADPRRAAETLLTIANPDMKVGESDECMGKPGVEIGGTFTSTTATTLVNRGCVLACGTRLLYVRYLAAPQIEELERPQLRAIVDAVACAR